MPGNLIQVITIAIIHQRKYHRIRYRYHLVNCST